MDVQAGQLFPHSHLRIQADGCSAIFKPAKVSLNTAISFSQEKAKALKTHMEVFIGYARKWLKSLPLTMH